VALLFAIGAFAGRDALAQDPAPSPAPEAAAAAAEAAAKEATEEEQIKREEVVVVTASKVESTVVNAPATISVVDSQTITTSPAQNFGDLLRSVPGMNVIQTSARDINLATRDAAGTLTNSQLTLLDGRSIYLDFFGMVLWDFVPSTSSDIKQIEVVRGPASAVWGANALTGVVNIITKTPREAAGGTLSLTGGLFDRDVGSTAGEGNGSAFGFSASYSGAPNDTWSYRVAGGYYNSDPFPRPTGTVPRCGPGFGCANPADPSQNTGGGVYPPFENDGTSQPKIDARLDQDLSNGARITYSAGFAGTEGIVHTGIGPFDIQNDSYMGYGRIAFSKNALRVSGFANLLDAKAPALLSIDQTGNPIQLNFKTQTYDLDVGNSHVLGGKHVLSYGGNVRRNNFDISIAPGAEDRTELGAYLQDELFFEKFRFTAGVRVDKFGNLPDPVFSPRVSAMFKPTPSHSFRISYNKAFRSPSVINNYLDVFLKVADFPLGLLNPAFGTQLFPVFSRAIGSEVAQTVNPAFEDLQEESLSAYEIGYTGTFGGRTTVGAAYYINDKDHNINFTTTPAAIAAAGLPPVYTAANPPPGWPLPPQVITLLAARGIFFPATFAYLNLGPIRNQGLELSIDHSFTNSVSAYVNYSWQDDPEPCDASVFESCEPGENPFPAEELIFPATHRFNVGVNVNTRRFLGQLAVNFTDETFWTDVLTPNLHGPVDSYTMVNATFGVKFSDGRVVTSLKGTNLTGEEIQQHIFGDFVTRNLVAEVRFKF
jgi:outer membrane receptor protein involved in Fe transport